MFSSYDVRRHLAHINAPTLVMARRGPEPAAESARVLASAIPNARLMILEPGPPVPYVGDSDSVLAAGRQFLASDAATPIPAPGDRGPAPLTVRETEVLSLLAGGHTGKEIAAELNISLSTAQRHIANIYAKIGARGRVDAAAYALARGLVRPRES